MLFSGGLWCPVRPAAAPIMRAHQTERALGRGCTKQGARTSSFPHAEFCPWQLTRSWGPSACSWIGGRLRLGRPISAPAGAPRAWSRASSTGPDGPRAEQEEPEAPRVAAAPRPAKAKKVRLDALIVERGLVESRSLAQSLILAGKVMVGTTVISKPGTQIASDAEVEVKGREHPWVSRGGMKLAKALEHFRIDVTGAVGLDVGASTGGFTDVLLASGARRVYAVDVGYGQLHWKLRSDERVVVLEKTNARSLSPALVPEPVDVVVCDASFIGLATVLPAAMALGADGCRLVALIKPQFEVGKGNVGKGGIVRDPALHRAVCERILAWLDDPDGRHAAQRAGLRWAVQGLTESPILGPDGNKEFLVYALASRDPGWAPPAPPPEQHD
eukprot:tig00020961_g16660.t1